MIRVMVRLMISMTVITVMIISIHKLTITIQTPASTTCTCGHPALRTPD